MEAARRQYRQKETTWAPPLQRDPGPWSRLVINWMATLAVIMAFGLVMLYSASYTTAYLRMGDSLHYIKQQILCMAIGIGCMAAMSYVDHRFLRWACKPCYWIVLLMLAATLAFPPLNGCRRWIRLGGLTLQTSEVAKFEMILLSSHLAASAPQIGRFSPSLREKIKPKDWLFIRIVRQLIVPVLPLVPVVVLLFLEPISSSLDLSKFFILLVLFQAIGTYGVNFMNTKLTYELKAGRNMLLSVGTSLGTLVLSLILVLTLPKEINYYGRILAIALVYGLLGLSLCLYVFVKGKTFYNREFWRFCIPLAIPYVFYNLADLLLGHSDVRTTLRLYVHSSMDYKRKAVEGIGFLKGIT